MTDLQILVADELAPEGMEILEAAGQVTVKKGMDEETLRAALPRFHALVVRSSTVVTAKSLELAKNLALIGRAGIGVDNIDVKAATAKGIVVMNTPEAGATTTGEHAMALLVSLARNIAAADASIKAGRWEKNRFTGVELTGKTLGILGLGRIGRVVAERGRGMQMEIIACDPLVPQNNAPAGVRMVTLEECLADADFLSLHVPLTEGTHHLLDRNRIAIMKKGARLVHAARGGIVDEEALCDALESGHLAGAALDVFEREPLDKDSRLLRTPNLLLTPHLGASTTEAKKNVSVDMARQILVCLKQGIVLNGINVPHIAPSDVAQVGPYLNLVHCLTSVLVQIYREPVQSLRLTIQGGLPESAHRPLTVAMLVGALRHQSDTPVTPVNAESIAEQRKVRVHTEVSSMKRDFMSLLRVEAVMNEERHFISGTVLGHHHPRMVELDRYLLDAIPEGPILITFHHDRPGVMGAIGTLLGEHDINISRMQLGPPPDGEGLALGVFNLSRPIPESTLADLRAHPAIENACSVM